MKIKTKLTKIGRNPLKQKGFINPGTYKGSTMIFNTFKDYLNDIKNFDDRTTFYGINKMYLLMEKQHNRGQDGAGFASIKLDVQPGKRFISRIRSTEKQPIQDVFSKINERINSELKSNPAIFNDIEKLKSRVPYIGEVLLGMFGMVPLEETVLKMFIRSLDEIIGCIEI